MRIFHGDWSHAATMLRHEDPDDPNHSHSGGGSGDGAIQRFLNGTATDEDLMILISTDQITAGQAASYKASKGGGSLAGTLPVTGDPLYYIRLPSVTPNATRFYDPSTGNVLDESGSTVTEAERKRILGMYGGSFGDGGGGGGSTRLASDDPRYWEMQNKELQLQYDKLSQDERIAMQQIQAQLINAGLDAETARRQALATLITNRNAQSVDLANVSGNIAAQAAQFAANPRDAIAELQFRNATEAGPAFGSIGNVEFGGYQSKLDDKFQQMFGGVAGDLSRAREFVSSIPPTEFFGAETRTSLGLPLLPQQELAGHQSPNPLEGLVKKLQGMSPTDQESFRRYTDPVYRQRQDNIENAYKTDPVAAEEFFRKLTEMNQGVVPSRAEDGINMNIHEPAAIVGMSGRVYATMAERDPEQLRVIPLPSVKKARAAEEKRMKEREKSGASVRDGDAFHAMREEFLRETRGAQRMATGGTAYVNPYGPEIPGLTGGIGEGRDPRTGEVARRGPGTGYDIAQKLRAGRKLGLKRGGGGIVDVNSIRQALAAQGGRRRTASSSTRTPAGMPQPNDTGLGTGGDGRNNVPTDFMGNIRMQLARLGVTTPDGQTLPDPRMLANGALSQFETDPILQAYIEAAYSRLGIDPRTLLATAQQYRPTGLNTGGGVPALRFI